MEKNLTAVERLENERKKREAIKNKIKKAIRVEKDHSDSDSEQIIETSSSATQQQYEPLDYEEAAKKYGIVFCDTNMVREELNFLFLQLKLNLYYRVGVIKKLYKK